MLLSRRVAVLLVAMVAVVLALGIMGFWALVSASPSAAHGNGRGHTLTVVTPTAHERFVDLKPAGVSQGDMRVVNAPLYNESGKKKVGRLDLFCVVTDPANQPSEKAHMAECTFTYTLPSGEISAQGVDAFPHLPGLPSRSVDAITGGTEDYANVRGEVRFVTRGDKVVSTFHLIG